MPQHDSNPKRESKLKALPDIETFYISRDQAVTANRKIGEEGEPMEMGWYYWFCFPRWLPVNDPIGPFATEAEALADARDGMDDDSE